MGKSRVFTSQTMTGGIRKQVLNLKSQSGMAAQQDICHNRVHWRKTPRILLGISEHEIFLWTRKDMRHMTKWYSHLPEGQTVCWTGDFSHTTLIEHKDNLRKVMYLCRFITVEKDCNWKFNLNMKQRWCKDDQLWRLQWFIEVLWVLLRHSQSQKWKLFWGRMLKFFKTVEATAAQSPADGK